jgi:hypothetical protein
MTATKTPTTYEEVTAHRATMRATFERELVSMLAEAFDGDADMIETVRSDVLSDAGGFGTTKITELGEYLAPRVHTLDGDDTPRPWTDGEVRAQRQHLARLVLADWFRPYIARTEYGCAFGEMREIELGLRAYVGG